MIKNQLLDRYPEMIIERHFSMSVGFVYPRHCEGYLCRFGDVKTLCFSRRHTLLCDRYPLPELFTEAGKRGAIRYGKLQYMTEQDMIYMAEQMPRFLEYFKERVEKRNLEAENALINMRAVSGKI